MQYLIHFLSCRGLRDERKLKSVLRALARNSLANPKFGTNDVETSEFGSIARLDIGPTGSTTVNRSPQAEYYYNSNYRAPAEKPSEHGGEVLATKVPPAPLMS
jgi:hypothetical protein